MMRKACEFYENIIIGGGWSGVEAANVLASNKHQVLLMTVNLDMIGWIQIPGQLDPVLKKLLVNNNTLLAEILEDKAELNKRWEYVRETKFLLDKLTNLCLRQDTASDIIRKENSFLLTGTSGQIYQCDKLFICAGTFIGSYVEMNGYKMVRAGRDNEITAGKLDKRLRALGVKFIKVKMKNPAIVKTQKGKLKNASDKSSNISDEYVVSYHILKKEQLNNSLECKNIKNLFFAGKCIGAQTTEKSALTGVIAGLGAIGKVTKKDVSNLIKEFI